jgi:hypothetical protein
MTAVRRMTSKFLGGAAAALLLAAPMPAAAQDSDAPVDVTAAPPPSSETIGPAQLQNFNLQGTVTRPAERPADTGAPPATPAPAQPAGSGTESSQAASGAPSGAQIATPRVGTAVSGSAGAGARTQPTATASSPALVTPSVPLEVTTNPAPQPGFSNLAPATEAPLTPTDASASWPWLAALLALIVGGTFIAWSRRGRRNRYADPGRLAFAGLAPDVVPEAKPFPPARPQPRPDPVPPQARPAPRAAPAPAPKPADDGLIVSKILKPLLSVQFVPDRLIVTGSDVALQFDVIIANSGSGAARDVLVEARMFTAHAAQDRDIGAFFKNPVGKGDRIPAIVPLGKLPLKSAVRIPLDQLHSFEVQGRRLFVPLVGFNILFRSNGGDDQVSASFLVGRGDDQAEKLAPFRIDLGPRVFRGLAARSHSVGLQQVA